jgi:hypothetical protein
MDILDIRLTERSIVGHDADLVRLEMERVVTAEEYLVHRVLREGEGRVMMEE